MKRAIVALALVATVFVPACGAADDQAAAPDATATVPVGGGAASAEGLDPIPADGAGESAAASALPSALPTARAMTESAGAAWPDVSGIDPIFVAYLVRADYDGQAGLFEVRADGIPHNLYAYQKAFDSGSIIWTPAANAQGLTAAPRSDRERSAVAAVEAAMADAFPGEAISYAVSGYRFAYVRDGLVVLTLEVDPAGGVIGVSQ